jgi:hypothetical protein
MRVDGLLPAPLRRKIMVSLKSIAVLPRYYSLPVREAISIAFAEIRAQQSPARQLFRRKRFAHKRAIL